MENEGCGLAPVSHCSCDVGARSNEVISILFDSGTFTLRHTSKKASTSISILDSPRRVDAELARLQSAAEACLSIINLPYSP